MNASVNELQQSNNGTGDSKVQVVPFFDSATSTFSYVVAVPGGQCAIIDSVWDYDAKSARLSTHNAQRIIQYVQDHQLHVRWIMETHAHADHLSASVYLKERLGGQIVIGKQIEEVKKVFEGIFNSHGDRMENGGTFDRLVSEGDTLPLGEYQIETLHVPGHTSACMSYKIDDAVFVGDTLFMPDVGSARCDFPGGDAAMLYDSVQRLYAFAGNARLFVCHDYPPAGRTSVRYQTSVAEQRALNIHLKSSISKEEFVHLRTARDKTLALPQLMIPSVQVNMYAGNLPKAQANGVRYLSVPINVL